MTKTVDIDGTEFAGAMKVRFADVEITSYTAGGEPFAPADVGMHRFQFVDAQAIGNGYEFEYDYANEAIDAYHGDYGATAAGPLVEVPGATAVGTVRVMCFGR